MNEKRYFQHGGLCTAENAAALVFPAITLLVVALAMTGISMNAPLILAVLIVGVVCFGLPHGSLDPLVAQQLFKDDRWFTLGRFFLLYGLAAALCAAGWLGAPDLALPFFLLISALHFGTDWEHRGHAWSRFAYGLCVVTVPTLHHPDRVGQIYLQLGAKHAEGIVSGSRVLVLFAIAVAFASLLPQIRLRRRDCLELAVILIAGLALPPLVFFVCYFCLLHSPRHLVQTSRELGLRSMRAIITAVAPTVGATLILAALLWYFLPTNQMTTQIIEIVFIGLAALTVPHMLLSSIKGRDKRSSSQVDTRLGWSR